MALEVEAAGAPLSSFLRDFPSPLGPGEPLPWSSVGCGALSKAEVPGALADRAKSFLDGRRNILQLRSYQLRLHLQH